MLVRHKATFNLGAILAVTFVGVLFMIFSPIFGGKNGLEYSDSLFNKLAKGSSYFIPEISKNAQQMNGKTFEVSVKMDKPEAAERASKMLALAGVQGQVSGADLKVSGDMGQLLATVLKDSDAMYHNNGTEISNRYGFDEKEAMTIWWNVLNKTNKELQKQKQIEISNAVQEVMKKGLEPAYNFYKIDAQSVAEKAGTMSGLLVFYVLYTMWWGYAIFYLFDGLGLSMKKAKVKKEV